jgi:hypothetical protein
MEKMKKEVDQISNVILNELNISIEKKRDIETEVLVKKIQDLLINDEFQKKYYNEAPVMFDNLFNDIKELRDEKEHGLKIRNLTSGIGLTSIIIAVVSSGMSIIPSLTLPIAMGGGLSAIMGSLLKTKIDNKLLIASKDISEKIITKITNKQK